MTNNGFFFSLENKKSRGKQLVILGHLLENAIGVGDGPGFSVFLFFCVDFSLCWSSLFCCCYKMATITLKIMSVFKAGEKEHDSTSHISLLNQGGQSTNHPYPPRLPHDFLDQSWFSPRTEHISLWLQSGSHWRRKRGDRLGGGNQCLSRWDLTAPLPTSQQSSMNSADWTQEPSLLGEPPTVGFQAGGWFS